LVAFLYCGDTGPQGLLCKQCGVDGMVYDDPVDNSYVVPEFNKDPDNNDADDKEEEEKTKSEQM